MNLRKIVIAGGLTVALALVAGVGALIWGGGNTPMASALLPARDAIAGAAADTPGALRAVAVTEVGDDEHVLGDPAAALTIIEYASLTCPHCASFHQETLPKLKEEWIDTGQARLVYRHYPLDQLALRAALLSNCFEGEKFFAVTDLLFKTQQRWSRAEDPMAELAKIGGMAGLNQERFRQCVTDQAEADAIIQRQLEARNEIDLTSTPTFVVEGEKLVGAQAYEAFDEKLREAAQ